MLQANLHRYLRLLLCSLSLGGRFYVGPCGMRYACSTTKVGAEQGGELKPAVTVFPRRRDAQPHGKNMNGNFVVRGPRAGLSDGGQNAPHRW